jgi:hypothetical protein
MQTEVEVRAPERIPSRTIITRRRLIIAAIILLVALGILALIFYLEWPFSRSSVIQSLQQQSDSAVQIDKFHNTFFPHPGCVAEGVTFRRGNNPQPIITIQRLTIRANYIGMLRHHIETIKADGLRVWLSSQQTSGVDNIGRLGWGVTIGSLIADGAEVDYQRADPKQPPLVFRMPKLMLRNLADRQALPYKATVQLSEPPAEVNVSGNFGPWQAGNAGQTRLSGSFNVQRLDLGTFGDIAGTLVAHGNFDGILQHLQVNGTTDVPDFVVEQANHPVDLATQFHAFVDGINGDVSLDSATVHFAGTTLLAAGTVAGQDDANGKIARLKISSEQARLRDLLMLVVSDNPAAMAGAITFSADVTLPPEDRPFLDRVMLESDFGITGAQYPNPQTQKTVDIMSARARGEANKAQDEEERSDVDPGKVLSELKGHVVLKNGVARLTNVYFKVPGASSKVSGTYQLSTEKVNLEGRAWLDVTLPKTTTGAKSFFLKIIQPFTHKDWHHGSTVTVKIGGTYHNPTFTVLPVAK